MVISIEYEVTYVSTNIASPIGHRTNLLLNVHRLLKVVNQTILFFVPFNLKYVLKQNNFNFFAYCYFFVEISLKLHIKCAVFEIRI